MPGKINYSFAGVPRLEISRTMTVLTNATPNVLAAPPNAQILLAWTTFRQAFGESMPQAQARQWRRRFRHGGSGNDRDGRQGPRRGGTRLRTGKKTLEWI